MVSKDVTHWMTSGKCKNKMWFGAPNNADISGDRISYDLHPL